MFLTPHGIPTLLKEGNRYFSGMEESTFRNIEACTKIYDLVKTSFGPNSAKKLIVSHIGKLFLTSDTATILKQLEIHHPAAKLIQSTVSMQKQEYGDGTNSVVLIAGQLLCEAELLLKQGLSITDIEKGYELALNEAVKIINDLAIPMKIDIRKHDDLKKILLPVVNTKATEYKHMLSKLIIDAVLPVLPSSLHDFDVQNIRVAKLTGGSSDNQSYVVNGIVVTKDVSGTVQSKKNCKVMVLGSGLEISSTETKSTVLLKHAEELLNFSKGEESMAENEIKLIAAAGIGAIIVGGVISDVVSFYCNKYDILLLKCQSKYELNRICKSLGAVSLLKLKVPEPDEVGYAASIEVQEISSNKITVIKSKDSCISTIVLRGATSNMLDEFERTINDGVNCIKNIIDYPSVVAGGGACELELSQRLQKYGLTVTGLEQYSVVKFGEALECIPKWLASVAGLNSTEVISDLHAAHKTKNHHYGLYTHSDGISEIQDVINCEEPILDHLEAKKNILKLAVDVAVTILKVDKIIMAKPAGGPKPPQQGRNWDED